MSLNYCILWIDDSSDWVEPVRESVERYMNENDLSPNVLFQGSGNEIETLIGKESIDLIILDQGLPGRNGDDLIKSVREHGEITEIIFYSQDDLSKNIVTQWQGVHYTHRDDAEQKISEVIGEFVQRSKSISIMRGIIIAEAIDVENKLTQIIKKMFGEKEDLFKRRVLDKAWLDFSKKCDFVTSCLNDKLLLAKGSVPVDDGLVERLSRCCIVLKDLKKDVVNQRNILAHSEKEVDDQGFLVLHNLANSSPKKIVFNNDWKNEIRLKMRIHRSNLQLIYELI